MFFTIVGLIYTLKQHYWITDCIQLSTYLHNDQFCIFLCFRQDETRLISRIWLCNHSSSRCWKGCRCLLNCPESLAMESIEDMCVSLFPDFVFCAIDFSSIVLPLLHCVYQCSCRMSLYVVCSKALRLLPGQSCLGCLYFHKVSSTSPSTAVLTKCGIYGETTGGFILMQGLPIDRQTWDLYLFISSF